MKWFPLFLATCLMPIQVQSHSELPLIDSSLLDGLPLRPEDKDWASQVIAEGQTKIDVTGLFLQDAQEGERIFYSGGKLLRILSEEHQEKLDLAIDSLRDDEKRAATWRAYLDLLEPMSPEQRVRAVRIIGFAPDPLVTSVVERISKIRSNSYWPHEGNPFADTSKPPPLLDDEEEARARSYEKILPGLIEASLQRMKASLEILDGRDVPAAYAKAEPPAVVPGR